MKKALSKGRGSSRRAVASAAALGAFLVCADDARAQGTSFDGPWSMTALTETFTIQQWGAACGPVPASGMVQPAGAATIRSLGGELVIETPLRTFRTDQCLDPMTTLARDAHSSDGKTWRTRCATGSGDPRHAVVNAGYFLTADNAVALGETGRYEFTLQGARCVADVTRQASLRRLPPPAATPSSATPTASPVANAPRANLPDARVLDTSQNPAAAAGTADCSAPGDPVRLEVRPSRKLLRLGDDFTFQAIVLDANGCHTATPIRWSIGAVRSKLGAVVPSIDGTGKLVVPVGDQNGATFDVVATAAGHSARAAVEVTSRVDFEALLAQSGLNAKGERDAPAVAILATSSLSTSDVRAEDGARRRRTLFIGIVGALAFLLGVVALFATLRTRRGRALESDAKARHAQKMLDYERQKREREERHAAAMQAHQESVARAQQASASAGPLFCPSCHREFARGSDFCPFDANRLLLVAGHEALIAGPAGGICPTCRRGFNPGVRVCPHDGDELLPQAMIPVSPPAVRGKICPTCGDRFDGTAAFCGKDGTQLVLLN
jgi:hypothetical protein